MIINLETIPVYLTNEEANLFVKFQRHHNLIAYMENVKAFGMRNGSVTIHFNSLGEIKSIEKKEMFNT